MVIQAIDVASIYEVPLEYHLESFDTRVLEAFDMQAPEPDLSQWKYICNRLSRPESSVTIAVIGKYVKLKDAYRSLGEAIVHGGISNNVRINLIWLEAEIFEECDPALHLSNVNAILVPGGFGARGIDGMIAVAKFARSKKIPYFGICLGMHIAVIEAARNLLGLSEASSSEFAKSKDQVVGLMTEWNRSGVVETRGENSNLGGTMRLGAFDTVLAKNSQIANIYGKNIISERHRHRYEINLNYVSRFEEQGVLFTGMSLDQKLPETLEIPSHPWFIAVQFHPELKSKPFACHPLFDSFVKAAVNQSRLV